jgi:hypothetical protein
MAVVVQAQHTMQEHLAVEVVEAQFCEEDQIR